MAASYNELFGLGTHSEDASLEGWWKLQETTGTSAVDSSSNSRSGTINGMGANPTTTTGPNNWLASAFDFDGSNDNVAVSIPDIREPFTLLGRAYVGASISAPLCLVSTANGSISDKQHRGLLNASEEAEATSFAGGGYSSLNASSGQSLNLNNWNSIGFRYESGTSRQAYANGSLDAASTLSMSVHGIDTLKVGVTADSTPVDWMLGPACDVSFWSRNLSLSELDEWSAGPEPLNTVTPSLSGTETVGEVLTSTTGTWDSQSNGTLAYIYQWTRSNDASGTGEADISGATSSTYTLVVADETKFIRCRVRASNDGGFDAAEDKNTAFTGAIAAASAGNSGSGNVNGVGTLAATGTAAYSGSGGVSAVATLAGVGEAIYAGSSSITAVGTLAATGKAVQAGSGSVSAIATLSGVGEKLSSGSGSVSAIGSLAGVGEAPVVGAATGSGSVTAVAALAGVGTAQQQGSGSITAIGVLAGVGTTVRSGSSTVDAIGVLAGVGTAPAVGTASGLGTITAVAIAAATGTTTRSGAGSFSAVGRLVSIDPDTQSQSFLVYYYNYLAS